MTAHRRPHTKTVILRCSPQDIEDLRAALHAALTLSPGIAREDRLTPQDAKDFAERVAWARILRNLKRRPRRSNHTNQ